MRGPACQAFKTVSSTERIVTVAKAAPFDPSLNSLTPGGRPEGLWCKYSSLNDFPARDRLRFSTAGPDLSRILGRSAFGNIFVLATQDRGRVLICGHGALACGD